MAASRPRYTIVIVYILYAAHIQAAASVFVTRTDIVQMRHVTCNVLGRAVYCIQYIKSYELVPGMAHYHVVLILLCNFMIISFTYFRILTF